MFECSFTNKVHVSSNTIAVTQNSDIASVSSEEFLDIQASIECRFTLKRVRDMIKTCSKKVLMTANDVIDAKRWMGILHQ